DPGEGRGPGGRHPGRLLRRDGAAAAARARPAGALRGVLPLHPVDRDLLRLPFDLDRLEGIDLRGLLQLLVEGLRDENLVGPRGVAEALGGIHRIADHGILEPPIRADVPREYFAEVDADPDGELRAALLLPLRVELLERCQLIERARSEERRVGKECRWGWAACRYTLVRS